LLIGVNAHINYDLVLTLVDMLRPEWHNHTEQQRASRYRDHCQINNIIGLTIDAVQDQVLEPAMPVMDLVDRLLGSVDERLISRLITHWREKVWLHATHLLDTNNPDTQQRLIQQIEEEAIETGKFILL
jgi:histidinol phosphatase-like PHP family hydrolase